MQLLFYLLCCFSIIILFLEQGKICSYPTDKVILKQSNEDITFEDNKTESHNVNPCFSSNLKNCTCHSKPTSMRQKRDLHQMHKIESNFVKKIFENNLDEKRILHDSEENEEAESPNDQGKDEDDYEKLMQLEKDEAFNEQQLKIANITNSTKFIFEEIETERLNSKEDDDQCDVEEENKLLQTLNAKSENKEAIFTSVKPLELFDLSLLKKSPSLDGLKKHRPENKPKPVDLNSEVNKKQNKNQATLELNNYVKLISKGNKLVEVPAVKLTVVPEQSTERRRRNIRILHFV